MATKKKKIQVEQVGESEAGGAKKGRRDGIKKKLAANKNTNEPSSAPEENTTAEPSPETPAAQPTTPDVNIPPANQAQPPGFSEETVPIEKAQETIKPPAEPVIPAEMLDSTIQTPQEPIVEPVVEKGYTGIKGDGKTNTSADGKPQPEEFKDPKNPSSTPDAKPATAADRKIELEQTADFVFDTYGEAKTYVRKFAKYDINKLRIRHDKGEIDLSQEFEGGDDDEGVSLLKIIETVNMQVDTEVVMKPGFVEKYKPAMMRVLDKHNLVMSDEWILIQGFGKDIIADSVVVMGLRNQIGSLLEYSGQLLEEKKEENRLKREILANQAGESGGGNTRQENLRNNIEDQLRHDAPREQAPPQKHTPTKPVEQKKGTAPGEVTDAIIVEESPNGGWEPHNEEEALVQD